MTGYRLLMLPPQDEVTRAWAARIAAEIPEAEVVVAEDAAQAEAAIGEAGAAYGTLTPELLGNADTLRWLQAPQAAPPAGYYFPELVAHPVVVTNFRGVYNDHVAFHAMALLLALARGLHHYVLTQSAGAWEPRYEPEAVVYLPEATVLVVGLGGIGGEIARLCKAFGCRVTATDARVQETPDTVDELHPPEALDTLLPEADFVVLTVPHTPATEGMIDRARLAAMKQSSYLINIGRGMTVRLDDLVAALDDGDIAGAGLDVFEIEPLPPDHPLRRSPRVLLTPHTAVTGPYIEERRFAVFADNARRFAEGKPLRNVVDKASWF